MNEEIKIFLLRPMFAVIGVTLPFAAIMFIAWLMEELHAWRQELFCGRMTEINKLREELDSFRRGRR